MALPNHLTPFVLQSGFMMTKQFLLFSLVGLYPEILLKICGSSYASLKIS